jgi:hypothetical protein
MTTSECVPNIGSAGRRQRMTFGVVALGVGVAGALALAASAVAPAWRLGLFLPFVSGGFGIFQARAST